MDAVKFMKEYNRICRTHNKCEDCPLYKANCFDPPESPREESEYSELVEVVERWSKENPEEIGKKYIIEIDNVTNKSCHACHVKGTSVWFGRDYLKSLKEYKGE